MNYQDVLKDIQEKQLKEVMIAKEIDELKIQGACYCQKLQELREVYNPHIRPGPHAYKLVCNLCDLKTEHDPDFERKRLIEEKLYEGV